MFEPCAMSKIDTVRDAPCRIWPDIVGRSARDREGNAKFPAWMTLRVGVTVGKDKCFMSEEMKAIRRNGLPGIPKRVRDRTPPRTRAAGVELESEVNLRQSVWNVLKPNRAGVTDSYTRGRRMPAILQANTSQSSRDEPLSATVQSCSSQTSRIRRTSATLQTAAAASNKDHEEAYSDTYRDQCRLVGQRSSTLRPYKGDATLTRLKSLGRTIIERRPPLVIAEDLWHS